MDLQSAGLFVTSKFHVKICKNRVPLTKFWRNSRFFLAKKACSKKSFGINCQKNARTNFIFALILQMDAITRLPSPSTAMHLRKHAMKQIIFFSPPC